MVELEKKAAIEKYVSEAVFLIDEKKNNETDSLDCLSKFGTCC